MFCVKKRENEWVHLRGQQLSSLFGGLYVNLRAWSLTELGSTVSSAKPKVQWEIPPLAPLADVRGWGEEEERDGLKGRREVEYINGNKRQKEWSRI